MTMIRSILALGVVATCLSACGNGNGGGTTPPVVTPAIKTEDQFGAGFGTRYRADPNTKATDPIPGDLIPLSLTTKPVPI